MYYFIGIVHGDIKPQNILIFEDIPGTYIARVADFGYSTYFASDQCLVGMPKSIPWNAPEHHHRGFLPSKAMKMDVYSFGMSCLWLLFEEQFKELREKLDLLERWKGNDELSALAHRPIKANTYLSDKTKEELDQFFSLTLKRDPDERTDDWDCLLRLLATSR